MAKKEKSLRKTKQLRMEQINSRSYFPNRTLFYEFKGCSFRSLKLSAGELSKIALGSLQSNSRGGSGLYVGVRIKAWKPHSEDLAIKICQHSRVVWKTMASCLMFGGFTSFRNTTRIAMTAITARGEVRQELVKIVKRMLKIC